MSVDVPMQRAPSFSVLMSVYYKENSSYLRESLSSVFSQSLQPSEVVLVEDGPLTKDLDTVVEEFATKHPNLKIILNYSFTFQIFKITFKWTNLSWYWPITILFFI